MLLPRDVNENSLENDFDNSFFDLFIYSKQKSCPVRGGALPSGIKLKMASLILSALPSSMVSFLLDVSYKVPECKQLPGMLRVHHFELFFLLSENQRN